MLPNGKLARFHKGGGPPPPPPAPPIVRESNREVTEAGRNTKSKKRAGYAATAGKKGATLMASSETSQGTGGRTLMG